MKNNSFLILVVFASLLTSCSKPWDKESEEISYDIDRIVGVYKSRFNGTAGYPNFSDIDVTINYHSGDTFSLSFDLQAYEFISNYKFRLVPTSINRNGSYFTYVYSGPVTIPGQEYFFNWYNILTYWDHYMGNGARFEFNLRSFDSVNTNSNIKVSGSRDY